MVDEPRNDPVEEFRPLEPGAAVVGFQDALYKARCPGCGSRVAWEAQFDADGTTYVGEPCCGFTFYMSPAAVNVTVEKA